MNVMNDYTKTRSKFWMKIFDDNKRGITLSANVMTKNLLNIMYPELMRCSPIGWKDTQYEGCVYLWIPTDCIDYSLLKEMMAWAEKCHRHVWLSTNKNIAPYFQGDELDYCLSADWNFDKGNQHRTPIGEAEFQIKYKYPNGMICQELAHQFSIQILSGVIDCVKCLPVDYNCTIITTIPATPSKQNKLAWQLASHCAEKLGTPFIGFSLIEEKPEMKNQPINNKISIWKNIYGKKIVAEVPTYMFKKDILIIDDLYQSGASIWCFAEYLRKKYNPRMIMAVTAVKALRDGDNL